MAFEDINSILVADIGSVHTRLVLIDLVEGQYRVIGSSRARTTAEPPLGQAGLGLEHATLTLTDRTGRTLLSEDREQFFLMPENEGHGLDEFLATTSAGRSMRVFLVGLTPEISLASGRRALAGSYVTITGTLTPDDTRSEEAQINALLSSQSDLILIVGGTDDGADETLLTLVRTVEKALSLVTRGTMPNVLFAGNHALRKEIEGRLSPLTSVFTAHNVRPSLDEELLFPAQIELALVFDDYQSRSPGGFSTVARLSQIGVVPTSQGTINTMRYLSDLAGRGLGPLVIDVGSANSLIAGGIHGEPHFSIHTDLGVGHSMVSALEAVTPAEVLCWLPFDVTTDDLWDYAHNKHLRPATVPGTDEDLVIEQAVARAIVQHMMAKARHNWGLGQGDLLPSFDRIIAAGAVLTDTQHPGMTALLLLDALQPTGITELLSDVHGLVAAAGVIAYVKPLITVQALETGGLVSLATTFCPHGTIRAGQDAMYIQVREPGRRVINHTVRGGEIWMAPVLPGVQVEVTIKLRRGLTLNGKRKFRRTLTAGAAGLIFDGRGRPLVMPRPRDRAARFMQWQFAMTGQEPAPAAAESGPPPVPSIEDLELPDLDELAPGGSGAGPNNAEDTVDALFS
jgi:hypothetical protein